MNVFEKSKVSMKCILLTTFFFFNKKTDDNILILHLPRKVKYLQLRYR